MAKLLIVEDNQSIADLYREEFLSEGYEVEVAGDGASALEKLKDWKPDVIILDIGLPEIDGLEVLAKIGAAAGRIPVVVNTAYPLFKMDFRANRARAWVTKSSNLTPLIETVERVIREDSKDS